MQSVQLTRIVLSCIKQLFLEPEWAMSQQPMSPKAEWAIDSEAMRASGIIVSVKSKQLVKKYRDKTSCAN